MNTQIKTHVRVSLQLDKLLFDILTLWKNIKVRLLKKALETPPRLLLVTASLKRGLVRVIEYI